MILEVGLRCVGFLVFPTPYPTPTRIHDKKYLQGWNNSVSVKWGQHLIAPVGVLFCSGTKASFTLFIDENRLLVKSHPLLGVHDLPIG